MSTPPNGQHGLYNYASFEAKDPAKPPARNFLWWCSGAYQKLLRQYPSEHTKYAGIGGVILATFALAALSSGYAIYSVFGDPYWTMLFAVVWGLVIFNFDRFLVSTMRKYGVSFGKQLQVAIPRFLLAFLIGITIARPLELKIFEKEIDVKVAENRHKKVLLNDSLLQLENRNLLTTAGAERARLIEAQSALQDTLHRLQQSYVQEADGTGGSGKRGIERLTKLKMEAYEQLQQQSAPALTRLAEQIRVQDSVLAAVQSSTESKRSTYAGELATKVGFLERNKALSDLTREESSVFWANLMVSLLIILVEVGPILSKLITSTGPYDIALAKMELLQMASSENEMRRDKELLFDRLKNVYGKKKQVSEELVQQLTDLQRKHMSDDLKQWENGGWKESAGAAPLDSVVKNIKEKYGYSEEDVL